MSAVHLWAFLSVKGGVGKSTLATACARLLTSQGRPTLVVDADMTGTSLADGLALEAPHLSGDPLDLRAMRQGFLSRQESADRRHERAAQPEGYEPVGVPFFGDALLFQEARSLETECRLDQMWWRHPDDEVRYLPSSPTRRDIQVMLQWLDRANQPVWRRRFHSLMELALFQMSDLTDIVIDLPPGWFGFSDMVMKLLADLSNQPTQADAGRRWQVRPFLVMTPDRNDLVKGMEEFNDRGAKLPRLVPLVNRQRRDMQHTRSVVDKEFATWVGAATLGRHLEFVADDPDALAKIFQEPSIHLGEGIRERLNTLFGLEGEK